ncbi:peptidoglycan recognition protein 1-like [Protopterus annectens]|uniref:peptidoglycan recognition protein 1-like n=1 Tax=Protopterus annectens TaxID=7888 RepID=UPI001CFB830F|nr:peptidoglycan recognition protein 1-like [Protopterus annectens]
MDPNYAKETSREQEVKEENTDVKDINSRINISLKSAAVGATIANPVYLKDCPHVITRSEWGALPPTRKANLATPVTNVIIHHSAGLSCITKSSCTELVENIQKYHMETNGWCDIGYSFLVGEDGNIYEGRGWNTVGAHTRGYNTTGYGICFLGTFTDRTPNSAAQNAATSLIRHATIRGYLHPDYVVKGHRDLGDTVCPGTELYNMIKHWPRYQGS